MCDQCSFIRQQHSMPYDRSVSREATDRPEWDEWDDEEPEQNYDGLDPAFTSWEEVNGMFFNKNY